LKKELRKTQKNFQNNGDVVLRIDGGMSLELPEDTIKQIQRQLTELQSNKF